MEKYKTVVFMNKKASIEEKDDGQRRIIALEAIPAGSLILEEKPTLSAVVGEFVSKVCHRCYREKGNLKRCSGCKHAHYCCEEEQVEDWKARHKKECAILKAIFEENSKPIAHSISMMVRVYVQVEVLANSELEAAIRLFPAHIADSKLKKSVELYRLTAELILKAAKDGGGEAKVEKYMDFMSRLIFAGSLVSGKKSEDDWVAWGVYPSIRAAAHSCVPNCFTATNQHMLHRLVAARSIQKGEQLTVSLIEVENDYEARKLTLRQNFFVSCSCPRCVDEKDDKSKRADPRFEEERLFTVPENKEDLERYLNRCHELFEEYDIVWFRVFEVATEAMMRLSLHQTYYGLLSMMMPKFLRLYEKHPINPVVGAYFHKLACLAHKLQDKKEAFDYASKSLALLEPYYKEKYIRELKIIVQVNET